ncbi:MAG: hypothetical protein GVY15_06235 [Bacteroidetes bacterium]|jgi:uncharacterized protein with NRDE domain|nr:hypothetical protein [Bacteroidota bacterium]
MCLLVWAYDMHPQYRLILAGNRDEFYARPTAAAARWPEHPSLVAGRDLRAGGTWMGVSGSQRFCIVTNVRAPDAQKTTAASRGALVAGYLLHHRSAASYQHAVEQTRRQYNGFNLLIGDADAIQYVSTAAASQTLTSGLYGLSNATLDTPWPKVTRAKRRLRTILSADDALVPALFDLLQDDTPAPDEALPDTGVPRDWERALSSIFIASPRYGTRASTVLLLNRAGGGTLIEQTYTPDGAIATRQHFALHPHATSNPTSS